MPKPPHAPYYPPFPIWSADVQRLYEERGGRRAIDDRRFDGFWRLKHTCEVEPEDAVEDFKRTYPEEP